MLHLNVNWLAVLVAAVAAMVVGFAWYSESLFGKQWTKLMGISAKEAKKMKKKGMGAQCALGFLTTLVTAYVLAVVLNWYGPWDVWSAMDAAFWVWLGFTATTQYGTVIWGRKPMKLFWINAGHTLVGVLVMASVLFYMA